MSLEQTCWGRGPLGDVAFKCVLDRFLSCCLYQTLYYVHVYFRLLRGRMRYNVFTLFDWRSTDYKLGEAGMEGEEADGVLGTCP